MVITSKRYSPDGATYYVPVAVAYHSYCYLILYCLSYEPITIPGTSNFEAMCGRIVGNNITLNILNIYRPHPYPVNVGPFLVEIQDLLSHLASLPQDLVILGDFNLHMDTDSPQINRFLEILASFNLVQHVDFPTHIHGHILDLIVTSDTSKPERVFQSDRISDHFTAIAEFTIPVPAGKVRKLVKFRKLKSINIEAFKQDILQSDLIIDPAHSSEDLAKQYNTTLSSILDKHAPLCTKQVSERSPNPWMTPEILAAKNQRRYLERVWRRNPTPLNRSRFSKQVHHCNRLMSKAKAAYYDGIVSENSADQRSMWQAFNQILHRKPPGHLPDCPSISRLATMFGTFFIDKITAIRTSLPDLHVPTSAPVSSTDAPGQSTLNRFEPASEEEIRRLIMASPKKSCELDPIPTALVKSCLDVLLLPITTLVNKSLAEGSFPSVFKNAHVTPLLKKSSLSKDDMKNYRPVSNLSFVSKIIEKVVANRIHSHLTEMKLVNPFQSAYKKLHSTETALLRIQNDILMAMDKGQVTALTLLDLSAAFDTIDHPILMDRLQSWFGFSGLALDWFLSYLSNRSQQVRLEGTLSPRVHLPFGVPQGSVLGPVLFTLYTTPLSGVIRGHSIQHQLYADDSQLYMSFSSADSSTQLQGLKSCLDSVSRWMLSNKLKLNPGKTEFLLIGHEKQRQKYTAQFPVRLMEVDTKPSQTARNLGVIFDQNFKFHNHISNICSSCYYHIRDLRRIRRHLSLKCAKSLACALVTSKLDYCNSLLYGVADCEIKRLQRVQDTLARIIMKRDPFSHAPPLRKALHWLPIEFRIIFKIQLLAYKTLQTGQPSYLNDLLSKTTPRRSLRSNQGLLLSVPRVKTVTGSRAFGSCAPGLWNSLPLSLRSLDSLPLFRKYLKTHLFGLAYPP